MIPSDGIAHERGPRFPTQRILRLIDRAIARYRLNLSGLIVLTEAATGYYRVTPVIAARAGASRVIAIARNNAFGSAETAIEQVSQLAEAAKVEAHIECTTCPAVDSAPEADVVTNLGAVRPIDARFARALSHRAAVSLMFGARDVRPSDIDVAALRERGVPLCGVDEDAIDLFRWTGQRIAWWLSEVGVEIAGARVLVWGNIAPARSVSAWLEGAQATVVRHVGDGAPDDGALDEVDAIVLMHAPARIEDGGSISPATIGKQARGAALLEYAGTVNREQCEEEGLIVYPLTAPRQGHVARTIGEILYAPVIELHTAGLRVGELMSRGRARGLESEACEALALEQGPGEGIPG